MGKASLFFVAGFMVLGVFQLTGTQRGVAGAEQRLGAHQYEVLARSAALAGYQQARQRLAESFDDTSPITGTYGDAAYVVEVARSGEVGAITSVGTVQTVDGVVRFRIRAEIERELDVTVASEPPPHMGYALLAEEDLSLNGDILADLYVRGGDGNVLNANVHTNGDLYIKGNSVEVRGFGSYAGWGSANPSKALYNSFRPYYNPTGAPTSGRADRVEIPAYDADAFAARLLAAGYGIGRDDPGNVTLSGSYDLGGTREAPYVWRVRGNLTASGGATLSGYVLFLVDGDVSFNGNLEAGDSGYDGSDESSIAIYTAGDISLGGNVSIYGQVFCGGDLAFMHGTPSVYGTLTTRGAASLRGTPNIYYRPASAALTVVFQQPSYHYRLASYSEW